MRCCAFYLGYGLHRTHVRHLEVLQDAASPFGCLCLAGSCFTSFAGAELLVVPLVAIGCSSRKDVDYSDAIRLSIPLFLKVIYLLLDF